MDLYGLIGYPLTHSFSKRYFSEKFIKEGIEGSRYDLFEMDTVESLPELIKTKPELRGLNVTIPHKQAVIPLLNELDENSAKRIGAVNTIKIFSDGSTKGYNTDYYGFRQSLVEWLDHRGENSKHISALVLGTGGASKAVIAALQDLKTNYTLVSRTASDGVLSYDDLNEEIIKNNRLIINTTPLGMYPKAENCPPIPYEFITRQHFLYDLVYNPENTLFLQRGLEKNAAVLNGLKMLHLQAEKAWDIWNSEDEIWEQ
jgi:shikimate dehydrogenase